MKKIIATGFFVAALLLPGAVSAHVLFTDTTQQHGIVLHINPDDDPIAGEETTFNFDIDYKGPAASMNYSYALRIYDEAGDMQQPAVYKNGDKLSAQYTFPSRGTYKLVLSAQPEDLSDQPIAFEYDVRVSRGVGGSPLDRPRFEWAEFGQIAILSTFLIVVIIIFIKRREISRYTKWK